MPPAAPAVEYTIAKRGRQRQPPGDPRPLLLFDLNGVLMHHRWDGVSHHHDLRPGVQHLLRLCRDYRRGWGGVHADRASLALTGVMRPIFRWHGGGGEVVEGWGEV